MPTAPARSRTNGTAPLPSGPAWSLFARWHPDVRPSSVAARWWRAAQLAESGAVSAPDPAGTRIVRSQSDEGRSYAVSVRPWPGPGPQQGPRRYACACDDYTGTHKQDFCKHVLAVWQVVAAQYEEQQAQAVLRDLLQSERRGFLSLLQAIRRQDARAAALAAAQLAGMPDQRTAATAEDYAATYTA